MQMQPDGNQHCIQFWRTGNCQWVGRCRFPHQCYVCGSPAHGTAQHSMAAAGMPPVPGMPPPGAPPGYGMPPPGYGMPPMGPGGVAPPAGAPSAGDWQCTSCGWGNYPERQTCRKCHMPRPAHASQALAAAGALLAPPDGKQHCIQFWRTGNCQWVGRCRYPHQCYICGSDTHGTGQHASMAVATASASAAVASVGGASSAPAPVSLPTPYEPTPYVPEAAAEPAPAAAPYAADAAYAAEPVPLPAEPAPAPTPAEPTPAAEPPAANGAAPPPAEAAAAPPPAEAAAAELPAGGEEERGRARSRSRSPVKRAPRSRSRSRSGQRAHSPEGVAPQAEGQEQA
jgi:Meckel syndrome type 1 protein